MNFKTLFTTINAGILCSFISVGSAQALQVTPTANSTSSAQSLVVRPDRTQLLSIDIKPKQAEFLTNEAIQFEVAGNKDFYLYLFSVTDDDESYLLFPSGTKAAPRFAANAASIVPGQQHEIIAQAEGVQTIISIASVKPVDWDFKDGAYHGDGINTDDLKAKILSVRGNAEDRNRSADSDKQANWLTNQQTQAVHIQAIYASVVDSIPTDGINTETTQTETATQPVIMVGTDKKRYKVGESVHLHFASTHRGYAHIFVAQPTSQRRGGDATELSFLTTQAVETESFNTAEAKATDPTGMHALLVVYSDQQTIDKDRIIQDYNTQNRAARPKGLSLVGEAQPLIFAMSYFEITR